jgi:hypothetical protein
MDVMAFEALAVFEKLVVRALYSRLHQVAVAVDAKFGVVGSGY